MTRAQKHYAIVVGYRIVCCAGGRTPAEAIAEARREGYLGADEKARVRRVTLGQMRALVRIAVVQRRPPTIDDLRS